MDSIFGITFVKLIKLLIDNKFNISIKKLPVVFILLLVSIRNSLFAMRTQKLFKKRANSIDNPPIFILGHWRSGTTFLHNLLIQDEQFIYPKILEVIHPNTFAFLEERYLDKIKDVSVKNRPMDNVKNDPMSAGEEEFAMAALTLKSPIVGWVFPKRYNYYEEYLSFENIPSDERKLWEKEYVHYLERINIDASKTLILKSPTNTARIKMILEMFPNAKFINIHRNPYDVYSSTQKLYNTAIKTANWQIGYKYNTHKRIINTYKKVYNSYFSQKDLIKKENFIEISFEELEKDTIGTIGKIYSKLNICNFNEMKPKLANYIESIGKYKKNKHPKLNEELTKEIYTEWEKYFKYWNYS